MKKTRVCLYGLLIVMMLLISACGGQPQQTQQSAPDQPTQAAAPTEAEAAEEPAAPAADPTATQAVAVEEPAAGTDSEISGTVKFAFPGEDTELRMRPEIIQMFQEKYPNIKVEEYPVPPDGYDTQLLADIAAGTPPDVFVSGDVQVAAFIQNKTAEDLTPYFEKDAELKEDVFFANVIDYYRGLDGHVYMMPDTYDVQRIYYNKALFDAAGLEYPQDGWTLEDFKNAAKAMTQGEGPEKVYGFFADSWWPIWLPYVWQNGGDLVSEDGTTCVLDQPEAVEALEWYADFIRQGYSPSPDEMEGMGMGGWDLFVTGRSAMLQSGGWEIPSFEEETDFEWGMVTLPRGKQPATVLHLTNYVMAANSENKEAAWVFMKFLASPEVYTLEATQYGWGVPPRKDVAEAIQAQTPEGTSEMNLLNVTIGSQSAEYGRLPTKILNFVEFRDDGIYPGLEKLWSGELSAADAAKQVCSIQPEAFK